MILEVSPGRTRTVSELGNRPINNTKKEAENKM
jgi:hypothetical protein